MTVILGLSLALNLAQAFRIHELNKSRPGASDLASIQVGTTVSPAKARDTQGRQAVISYDDVKQPVVLYVFTPQCPWCSRNLDNLRALVSQKRDSYRFIGLSLTDDGLTEYLARNKLDLPVYVTPAEETKQEYKLGNTPQTIVISPGGKVVQNWVGAYAGPKQAEVENFFGVKLPGLAPSP
jgi:peroxiredoxin